MSSKRSNFGSSAPKTWRLERTGLCFRCYVRCGAVVDWQTNMDFSGQRVPGARHKDLNRVFAKQRANHHSSVGICMCSPPAMGLHIKGVSLQFVPPWCGVVVVRKLVRRMGDGKHWESICNCRCTVYLKVAPLLPTSPKKARSTLQTHTCINRFAFIWGRGGCHVISYN